MPHGYGSPRELLASAALAYANADGDEEFRRAWVRLRKAAFSYIRAKKHPNQHTAVPVVRIDDGARL